MNRRVLLSASLLLSLYGCARGEQSDGSKLTTAWQCGYYGCDNGGGSDSTGDVNNPSSTSEPSPSDSGGPTAPIFLGVSNVSIASPTSMMLSWAAASDDNTPPDKIAYLVYVQANYGAPYQLQETLVTTPGVLAATVSGLAENTTYFVSVRAVNLDGKIDQNTVTRTVTTPDTSPPKFTGIREAVPTGPDSVMLRWDFARDNKDSETDLWIQIFVANSYGQISYQFPNYFIQQGGAAQFKVTGLLGNSDYYFAVRAVDTSGNVEKNTVVLSAKTLVNLNLPAHVSSTNVQPDASTAIALHELPNGEIYYGFIEEISGSKARVYKRDISGSWKSLPLVPACASVCTSILMATNPADGRLFVVVRGGRVSDTALYAFRLNSEDQWVDLHFPTGQTTDVSQIGLDPVSGEPMVYFKTGYNINFSILHLGSWMPGSTSITVASSSFFRVFNVPGENFPFLIYPEDTSSLGKVGQWNYDSGIVPTADISGGPLHYLFVPAIVYDPLDGRPILFTANQMNKILFDHSLLVTPIDIHYQGVAKLAAINPRNQRITTCHTGDSQGNVIFELDSDVWQKRAEPGYVSRMIQDKHSGVIMLVENSQYFSSGRQLWKIQ